MTTLRNLIIAIIILFSNSLAFAQAENANAPSLASAKVFMLEYGNDLLGGKREAIINRYDPRGHYRLGNGKKAFLSLDEVKENYLGKWNPPISFAWRDLSFEAIGSDAMVVSGLFDWETSSGEKRTYSYTSLLLLQNGAWKIRLEDESRALPPPAAKP
jgi:hypothetical protein